FFQAAGIQTTILTRSPLMATQSLHHVDDELRDYVVEGMRLRGVEILEGVEPQEVLGNGKATGVQFRNAAGEIETRDCDFVFIATGERAQSQPFVDALGVEVDDRMNIKVDWTMKTSVEDVYAVGDLIGPPLEMFKARSPAASPPATSWASTGSGTTPSTPTSSTPPTRSPGASCR